MKTPDNKARRTLVDGYAKSPELLEYKLYQVFEGLKGEAQIAVHNDITFDIRLMIGDGLKKFVEDVVQSILNVSQSELNKEKK